MFYGAVEGTGFEVLDPRFNECLTGHGRVERLWTGRAGPKGRPGLRRGAIWSGPTFRTTACCATMKPMARFRFSAVPSNNSNGNTVDREGRLVSCEHLARRVTRTEHNGSITVIADNYEGNRFNSPNDVVVKSDGSIWFTDPPYGHLTDYEGEQGISEIGNNNVYRVDPMSGEVTPVCD